MNDVMAGVNITVGLFLYWSVTQSDDLKLWLEIYKVALKSFFFVEIYELGKNVRGLFKK